MYPFDDTIPHPIHSFIRLDPHTSIWLDQTSLSYKFILLIPSFDPTHPFSSQPFQPKPYFRTSSPSQAVQSQHSLLFLYKGKLNFAPYISNPLEVFPKWLFINFHASLEWGTTRYNLISLILGSWSLSPYTYFDPYILTTPKICPLHFNPKFWPPPNLSIHPIGGWFSIFRCLVDNKSM